MVAFILFVLYAANFLALLGIMHQSQRVVLGDYGRTNNNRENRQSLGISIISSLFLAFIPVSAFVAYCITGFAVDGWSLSCSQYVPPKKS